MFAGPAVVGGDTPKSRKWPIGHHFWNWDRAWDKGEFLETRLTLTRQTGYDGFEAKPHEIGRPPEAVREKCAELGIRCAAVGGDLKEAIDYAFTSGAKIVRSGVPKEETKRWVDYAVERNNRVPDYPQSARNMRSLLRSMGY